MRSRLRRLEQAARSLLAAVLVVALPVASAAQEPEAPAVAEPPPEQERLQLRVFGNLDWLSRRAEAPSTFTVGQLDLFAIAELAPGVSVLTEVVLEAPHHEEAQIAEVERFQLRWAPSDVVHVSAGRMHTMLGYWNQAYHHGAWMQTSILRPEVYRWEDESGGFLPMHEVGLRLSGAVSLSPVRIEYSATLANGRAPRPTDVVTLQDPNQAKAYDFWVGFRPRALPLLQVGVAAVLDTIPPDPARPERAQPIDERILGAFVAYPGTRLELLAEAFSVRHEEAGSGRWDSNGFYVQAALALGRFKPYVRYDRVARDEQDPYYESVTRDLEKGTLGLRFDPLRRLALKLELARTQPDEGDAFTAVAAQAAFTF